MEAAVKLTEGAVKALCGGATADNFNPTMQVMELKKVPTKQQLTDRYRVMLSDGSQLQQGMIATPLNNLVDSGMLQRGSIITLTEYSCSNIQGRLIIIIMQLDVIVKNSELVGQSLATARASGSILSTDLPGSVPGNAQTIGGSSQADGPVDKVHAARESLEHPVINQLNRSAFANNSGYGRTSATTVSPGYLKPEGGAGFLGSAPIRSTYSEQDASFRSSRPEVSRQPFNSATRTPYSGHQQPPPMYNRGPMARKEAPPRMVPIAALNFYQSKWTIKARVTMKGELRNYNNTRGDGKVFSFDLLDSGGGEIRATCFNAVADQFYNLIETGKVYLISKGTLKAAQTQYNHLRNDLELALDSLSVIEPCLEDDKAIPQQHFRFRSISDIEKMDKNSIVDVIGVVLSISPPASIMRKNGTETFKRTLRIMDMSSRSVELTLWGKYCNEEGSTLQTMRDSGAFPILALKFGRVNDFGGKAVGTTFTSQLFIEPDFSEACSLKEWFHKEGRNTQCISISREISGMGRTDVRKTICQIKDENLGTSEKPDWIIVSATVIFIKCDNFCYTACAVKNGDRQCNKKVTNNGDGKWWCERCEKALEQCDYRYILQLQIQDHTGITWVTAFQEIGEELLGISAKDLYEMKFENQDDGKFSKFIRQVMFAKYMFKLKVKEEIFNDEARVKSTVVRAENVNQLSESSFLLEKLNAGDPDTSFVKAECKNLEARTSYPGLGSGTTGNVETGRPPTSNPKNSYSGRELDSPAKHIDQYGNMYSSSLHATDSCSGFCHSCGGSGHILQNCPSIKSVPEELVGAASGSGITGTRQTGPPPTSHPKDRYSGRELGQQTKQVGQQGNIYSNPFLATDDSIPFCSSCGVSGHISQNCPSLMSCPEDDEPVVAGYGNRVSPGTGIVGASGECFKCHKTGHWPRDCPTSSNTLPAYGRSGMSSANYGVSSRQHVGGF